MKTERISQVQQVLDKIYSLKGRKILSCIHNREPNGEPDKQTKAAFQLTGVLPAMWSGDFLFSPDDVKYRQRMIDECIRQYKDGAIVHLMLHVAPPYSGETCVWQGGVLSDLSDEQWTSLITDGGELNVLWKKRLDVYAAYLQQLKDQDIPVLFRPFHEMNQGLFWWGGRKGKDGTGALYRLTRDYLEDVKGLDNIIWVWDIQDLDYEWKEYDPGREYWDILGVDFYDETRYTDRKYELALEVADGRPIAIGECDVLPSDEVLEKQTEWVFCMSWAELTFSENTEEAVKKFYHNPRTQNRPL